MAVIKTCCGCLSTKSGTYTVLFIHFVSRNYDNMIDNSLPLDWSSIDISGAQEKEGYFCLKNFLRALKVGITCHTYSINNWDNPNPQ